MMYDQVSSDTRLLSLKQGSELSGRNSEVVPTFIQLKYLDECLRMLYIILVVLTNLAAL
jgi:hypothetical protein